MNSIYQQSSVSALGDYWLGLTPMMFHPEAQGEAMAYGDF